MILQISIWKEVELVIKYLNMGILKLNIKVSLKVTTGLVNFNLK